MVIEALGYGKTVTEIGHMHEVHANQAVAWPRQLLEHGAGAIGTSEERAPITIEADFCVDALSRSTAPYGASNIVNTDRGSQLSSAHFVEAVKECGAGHGMDGRDCRRENVFVEMFVEKL